MALLVGAGFQPDTAIVGQVCLSTVLNQSCEPEKITLPQTIGNLRIRTTMYR